jgi:hypothetical protein
MWGGFGSYMIKLWNIFCPLSCVFFYCFCISTLIWTNLIRLVWINRPYLCRAHMKKKIYGGNTSAPKVLKFINKLITKLSVKGLLWELKLLSSSKEVLFLWRKGVREICHWALCWATGIQPKLSSTCLCFPFNGILQTTATVLSHFPPQQF